MASQASPKLSSLTLRFDGAKAATLKLPVGVQLPAGCSINVVGALRLLSYDTSVGGGCDQRRVAAACSSALVDALLTCGAGSLSVELCWNVPVYRELKGSLGAVREATTAHQLAASLLECAQAAGSPIQISCTDAINGLRLVLKRR